MLVVQSLTKHYGDVAVLADVGFQLRDGERVALVGPNGAGKSTLMRLIARQLEPDRGQIVPAPGSRIAYLPQDAGVEPGRTVHEEMASVFGRIAEIEARQTELHHAMEHRAHDDPALLTMVDEQAALLAEFERLDGYTVESNIGRVLGGLGFDQADRDRQTAEFSGGWQMRIALAKLLLQAPDVLLLDEPTNHLDLAAIEWLEDYLVASRSAALIVSHDRYFLDRVTRRTLELRDSKVLDYPMPYSQFVVERIRRQEAQLAAFERQQDYLQRQSAFVERFRASATKSSSAKSREKMLGRIERVERPRDDARIAFRFAPARPSGREVVEVGGVQKAYGDTVVFRRVDLSIERGERIGLLGPNGAGKSTLLRMIAGVERPDRGRVTLGHNVQIAYYSQSQAESLDARRTVMEEIQAVAPNGATQTELRDLLARFLFRQEDVYKSVSILSGGERARLALARILLRPTNTLLLDEPTNHLDVASREVLEAALRAYEGTVVIASHDRYLLDCVVTRIVEVGDGSIASFLGNYSHYREQRVQAAADRQLAARPAAISSAEEPPDAAAPVARPNGPIRVKPEREARAAANRLARLESEVELLASRREQLEARLVDPDLWSDPNEAQRVVDDLARVQAEIEIATTRWDELVATT